MEAIVLAETGLHPLAARDLDARLAPYLGRLSKLGLRALPLLTFYIRQGARPRKVRLHAAAALGIIADPGALPALRATASDRAEDPGLRSTCVQAIGSLHLAPHEKRAALDPFAAPDSPPAVAREALGQLSSVGTDRVGQTAGAARALGSSPSGAAALTARSAVSALGLSPDHAADAALIDLIAFWRVGAAPRGPALATLARRRVERRRFSPTRAQMDVLLSALVAERGDNALSAARLLGLLGDRRAVAPLTRMLKAAPDAALAAEAAQALAALGDPSASGPVAALAGGLAQDERFGARPDAGPLAAAIEAAARTLNPPAKEKNENPQAGFTYEGWPGSGVPHPLSSAERPLVLRAAPQADAKETARLPARANEPLRMTASRLKSTRSGWARARAATTLDARSFGKAQSLSRTAVDGPVPKIKLALSEGELLEVLAPRAEGDCFIRRGGEVFEAACPHLDRERFEVVEEPASAWWLEIETSYGRGWVDADDPALTILRD